MDCSSQTDFDECVDGWTVYLTLENRRKNVFPDLHSEGRTSLFSITLEDKLASQPRLLDSLPTRLVKLKKFWQWWPCQASVYLEISLTVKPTASVCSQIPLNLLVTDLNRHRQWAWVVALDRTPQAMLQVVPALSGAHTCSQCGFCLAHPSLISLARQIVPLRGKFLYLYQ